MEIKTKEELDKVLKENDVVIVRVHAEWCGQCKMLDRTISDIEKEAQTDAKFIGIDAEDADENLIMHLGVRNLPTIFYYKNGVVIDKTVGLITEKDLIEKLNTIKNGRREKLRNG